MQLVFKLEPSDETAADNLKNVCAKAISKMIRNLRLPIKQGSADEMLVELRKATRARLQRPLFPPPGPAVRYSPGSRTETEESDAGNADVARVSKLLAQLNAESDSNMETDQTPDAATSAATGPVALPSAESSA